MLRIMSLMYEFFPPLWTLINRVHSRVTRWVQGEQFQYQEVPQGRFTLVIAG